MEEELQCSVCWGGKEEGTLVHAGCRCSGTGGILHEQCLRKTIDAFHSTQCRTCQSSFLISYPWYMSIAGYLVFLYHFCCSTCMLLLLLLVFSMVTRFCLQVSLGWSWILAPYFFGVTSGLGYLISQHKRWDYEDLGNYIQALFMEMPFITIAASAAAVVSVALDQRLQFLSGKGRYGRSL